jgi:hypothetical protein
MVIVAVSTGCTMCPDPFDYSGPVPNGSAPQNDFWARSNGILPLHAAPRPWPLIVKNQDQKQEEGQPTPVDPTPAVIAESPDAAPSETRSVLR